MTYPIFLAIFLLLPIGILSVWWRNDVRQGWWLRAVAFTIIASFLYTTPWDNYLVATRVWYYDTTRVWNIVLGYVPLEEYLFFGLQVILTSLITLRLMRRTSRHG